MHPGKLDTDTAAARVWRYLLAYEGVWTDAWGLTVDTRTTAISTRISEVRHQLPDGYRLEHERRGQRNYYRVVREDET